MKPQGPRKATAVLDVIRHPIEPSSHTYKQPPVESSRRYTPTPIPSAQHVRPSRNNYPQLLNDHRMDRLHVQRHSRRIDTHTEVRVKQIFRDV
ncbi:hypothetical protein TSAR_011360 [Trichomalopsis sarcophagae]|uniref:Uncharacterized protein n=1 Tax=Trichomalopsis sarcophagae TaxID=543379 RepID=A0A232EVR1_9HYME|nr:hypothetical protein TSAR_011360 [Trichomalopsis sarcophagae]